MKNVTIMEINGEAVVLESRGNQACCLTTNDTLILRAQNKDTSNNATVSIAYGGYAPEYVELKAGFSTVTIPIKIANFYGNILTVTNISNTKIAVRLNGSTCACDDGKLIPENNDTPIVLNNNEIGFNCTPSPTYRELSLTALDNGLNALIVYGIKDNNKPFLLGLNCDAKGQTKCPYLSYLDAGYDEVTLNNWFKLPVQKCTDVTVINISPSNDAGVNVELYTLDR